MSTITAGTSRQRTSVASTATATPMPTPNCLTVGSPLMMKAKKTLTMISAAEVMTRPVVPTPVITASRLSPLLQPCLPDVGHQEHLVVHREPEQDREHHQRDEGDDRHLAVQADQARAPALLEHRADDAERRADRDEVHEARGQRDHQGAEREHEQQEAQADDDHDRDDQAGRRSPSREVDVAGGRPADVGGHVLAGRWPSGSCRRGAARRGRPWRGPTAPSSAWC